MHLEGELNPDVLALAEDQWADAGSGIRYVLDAELLGEEVLVRGSVEADLKLLCSRSGAFFSTTLGDSSFLRAYLTTENPELIDLTDELREAVLIEIPSFPVSPEAQSEDFTLPGVASEDEDPAEDEEQNPWSGLDGLDLS